MRAIFHPVPLNIVNMFFDDSHVSFRPSPREANNEGARDKMFPGRICVSQQMAIDEQPNGEADVQISIAVSNEEDADSLVCFNVRCVCIYKWADKNHPAGDCRDKILSWAAAIQLGAIRQHLISETAKGPFRVPYYLPICLVGIENEEGPEPTDGGK
jgi:hypothetical protein